MSAAVVNVAIVCASIVNAANVGLLPCHNVTLKTRRTQPWFQLSLPHAPKPRHSISSATSILFASDMQVPVTLVHTKTALPANFLLFSQLVKMIDTRTRARPASASRVTSSGQKMRHLPQAGTKIAATSLPLSGRTSRRTTRVTKARDGAKIASTLGHIATKRDLDRQLLGQDFPVNTNEQQVEIVFLLDSPSHNTNVMRVESEEVAVPRINTNDNASFQLQAVKQVFTTAQRFFPSQNTTSYFSHPHEILGTLQGRIRDYIFNMQDPSWQPWPFTPPYPPSMVYWVLEELHSVAIHAAICAGEEEEGGIGFEALVDALQGGMQMLERGIWCGDMGRWKWAEYVMEGVTEMHVAVWEFVEQVFAANGMAK